MTIFCATTNRGKLKEFREAAGHFDVAFDIEVLPELRSIEPCEETGTTFEENAVLKARHYGRYTDGYLFVDDSGLEVDALNGAPGVYSARFAGEGAGDAANNSLLLQRLRGVTNRTARFVCVVALAKGGEVVGTFRGAVEGEILHEPRGTGGFGYDPLFWYPPFACSFGEVDAQRKMKVSHRGEALEAMFRFLTDTVSKAGNPPASSRR